MSVQTNGMGSDKKNLIGELYALRAGISVVSQEKNITDEILEEAQSDCRQADIRKQQRIDEANKEYLQAENMFSQKQREITQVEGKLNSEMYYRKELRRSRWIMFLFIALIIITLPLFFTGLPFFAITWTIERSEDVSDAKKDLKEVLEAKKNLPYLQKETQALQAERDRLAKVLEETQKIATEQAESDKREILERAKNQAEPHVVAAREYAEALEETFGDMLDTRDWGNLDLFIYAIETRRADDIKSAFNYVDDERRTDRLARAIQYAGEQICASIEGGLKKLSAELNRGFTLVSGNVAAINDRVAAIGSGVEKQNRQLLELTDAQRMNNALTEKAAESSANLADDVKQLRANSDYVDWQLRNNY